MGLKVWLPLIKDAHDQGTAGIATTPTNITFTNMGKLGTCAYFTGVNTSYIDTTYSTAIGTSDFTISLWLKLPTIGSGTYYAICDSKRSPAAAAGFGIVWNYSQKKFLWSTADGSSASEVWMATAVNDIVYDKWIHLVMVRNSGDAKKGYFYINGTRYELASVPAIKNITTDTKMRLGQCIDGAYPTKMYINDFRIYDYALSVAEIHELSQGLVLHYKLDTIGLGYGNPNLCKNSRTFGTGWSGSGAITQNAFNGFATKYHDNSEGTSYTDVVYYSNVLTVNTGEKFTASFWAKADVAHSISCFFYNNTSGVVQNISAVSSTGTTSTSTDGHIAIALTTEWKYYWITWTMGSTGDSANKHLLIGRNTAGQSGITIAAVKLERGDSATPWAPHPDDSEKTTNDIIDSSGYNYNSTLTGTATITKQTGRHSTGMHFGSYRSPYTALKDTSLLPALTNCTVTYWCKHDNTSNSLFFSGQNTSYYLMATNTNNNYYHGSSGTITVYRDGIAGSYKSVTDGWHFLALTGVNLSSWTQLYINSYSSWPLNSTISDVRIYATQLSAEDIKQLYEVSAKIDNHGQLHAYEFNETNSNKLTKTGIFYNNAIETYKILPDGSCWKLLLFHWVDKGTNLFTSSNAGYYTGPGLYSRLNEINSYMYDSKYEYYVLQDGVEYRWTQTNAPLTTTSVTGFTAVTGNPGGGICKCSGNTLLAATNSTGNWWRACGCWTIYNGGIPGFGNSVICKKYIALYARISKITYHQAKDNHYANNLIEI